MTTPEETKEKEIFMKKFFPFFTEYLDINKLEKKIPSYKYLNTELDKLEKTTTESTYKHVMSKKILLLSKNAKQLCRDGIPLKHFRQVLIKMFNVNYSKEDIENKKLEVLKNLKFSDIGEQYPVFCDKKLEGTIVYNYLNEKGIQALKEVLWLINGVYPKVEYCPALANFASFLLLFLSKEETYELLRNLMEADMNPGDMANIRWHFRYTLEENIRLYCSIVISILEISKQQVVNQFKSFETYGVPKIKLVKDMSEKFFIDYFNFIGMFKFVPFFLYEGAKGIYRFIYGIIASTPFKLVKEAKKEEKKIVTLNEQISNLTKIDEKYTCDQILQLFKDATNQLQNWQQIFDVSLEWDLTHRNNGYSTLKIPNKIKDAFLAVKTGYYIPSFYPESKILTKEFLPKLWEKVPIGIKFADGIILFDKSANPQGDLNNLYTIFEKLESNTTTLFLIKTKAGDIFGGIFDQGMKLSEDGKYKIPNNAYLFSILPELNFYSPKDNQNSEIVCFEPGAFRYGNGKEGPAITIDNDLSIGWTHKDSVFGNNICLLKDYSDEGQFIIDNMEIYTMQ